MNGAYRIILLLLLAMLLLSGCQTMGKKKQNALEQTLRTYQTTARWGHLDSLYVFLQPELAGKTKLPDGLDNIRVTKYEVLQPAVATEETSTTQSAMIYYLFRDRQVERKLMDHQIWEYDEETNRWFRTNPIPEFR
jgi:hypothetical protein